MTATQAYPLTRFGMMAKKHMQTHLPKMYRTLLEEGTLDRVLYEMQEATKETLEETKEQLRKTNPPPKTNSFMETWQYNQWLEDTAWEMVKDRILLPEEPEAEN